MSYRYKCFFKKIILTFIDSGIGIPKEDLDHIFDLFYRGKNKNFEVGHGIGLSVVRQIISLHNGLIVVNSEIDKGTSFVITLDK